MIPLNHFDRGKPFYPLIINYVTLLFGFKEFAARGLSDRSEAESTLYIESEVENIINDLRSRKTTEWSNDAELERHLVEVKKGLFKIKGPLELRSEFQRENIRVEIDEIARDIFIHHKYIIESLMSYAGGGLLILAYEINKDQPWRDKKPLWEFLRHCRNAAAHGGRFKIEIGEPRHLAEWGNFKIETALDGTNLFKDAKGVGMLSPGDPIRLLWDIEKAYPTMQAFVE